MDIKLAQQDIQTTFVRGSIGQAVSGIVWLISSALSTWVGERYGILALVFGGMFIFPLTQLTLRLFGRPSALPKGHPMNQLATQVAFVAPLLLPLVGAASLYHINWFYPAFMTAVGAHYLPFIFLYGMWEFSLLAITLLGGGIAIGILLPDSFTVGGWFTGVLLLLFAVFVQFTPRFSKQ
jgi:uncharacterized protein DUF7010